MAKQGHFRRAHSDENHIVDELYEKGGVGLRIPISGAGRFKGDVIGFINGGIELVLVRRTERNGPVRFSKMEIYDLLVQIGKLRRLIPHILILPVLYAHRPREKKWVRTVVTREMLNGLVEF